MNTSLVYNGLFSVTFNILYKYAASNAADSEECWICIKRKL